MEKHPGGRPPKYETPEQLESAINTYFEACAQKPIIDTDKDGNKIVLSDKTGKPMFTYKVPTTAGLARHLGYADRQSLYDLKSKDEFSCLIKRAMLAIEDFHEGRLGTGEHCTGSIFWMKNHGWRDRQEFEHSGSVQILDDIR